MNAMSSLANHFLIAMPGLDDPNFTHTVTYICEHNDQGAMGIVINRPLPVTLADILTQLDINASNRVDTTLEVFEGGPVQREHGFVIHSPLGAWESTLRVTDQIAVSTSRDILTALAHGEGPSDYLLALGYAGWGAGQLEQEIAANIWLSGPADSQILFRLPAEQRWTAAAALLGVDLNLISGEAGHA